MKMARDLPSLAYYSNSSLFTCTQRLPWRACRPELGAAALAMAQAVAVAAEEDVIIVGAGQSGLAVAACLSLRGVRALVLERDDCVGSLWRKRAYDRLHLHLGKKYSALPHAPHPDSAPTYLHRDEYAAYLDGYAARFAVRTRLRREVRCARYDRDTARWEVEAVDLGGGTGEVERYAARFLVVASGENAEKFVPEVPGLEAFPGQVMHAAEYRSAEGMQGKAVLVVGSGNSGMEIAYDLAAAGAVTSIVVRSEVSNNLQYTAHYAACPALDLWYAGQPATLLLHAWLDRQSSVSRCQDCQHTEY
jgi:cation diffusion facilitator CzcD-associated flavoprotein CzcO